MNETCPECGAVLRGEMTCQDYFHQMLFWENDDPANGAVHHLAVLCYYLQHPSLYAPDGLEHAKGLLVQFVEQGVSPQMVRAQIRDQVDSGKRGFKIKATATQRGVYAQPIHWSMTAADVVAAGIDYYVESVNTWARAALESLRESGNLR
jgi:hypothetical protein